MMDGVCSFSILAILGICNRNSKISMDDHIEKTQTIGEGLLHMKRSSKSSQQAV